MTSAFYILPHYWDKRRGMATAIAMAGICTGQFLAPVFITYLQENIGFKNTALIVGAIFLNAVPASSLFHPVEWHSPQHKLAKCTKNKVSFFHFKAKDKFNY